ncbi:cryptic beta-D-galactosidase subunit alpha [compost metagenome]
MLDSYRVYLSPFSYGFTLVPFNRQETQAEKLAEFNYAPVNNNAQSEKANS